MADRINRALVLLQTAPLPVDLIDNPYRTTQWLSTVNALHQTVLVLLTDAAAGARPPDSRSDRLMRRFMRLTDGLPQACLAGLPPVTKLGLLRPLLADIECRARRLAEQHGIDMTALEARLRQYRTALAAMAARLSAPEPPGGGALRRPQVVPGH
jgi:hypothetical protein